MAQVEWTEPALDDLQAITAFVSRDSPAYAARLAQKIVEAPRRLATLPQSGARVPEFDRDDIRELSVRLSASFTQYAVRSAMSLP